MRKTHARQGHAPPARKNRKTPQKPAKLLNVTEDADLRYRLARHGFRSSVISAPTAEEAPVSFAAWAHQRSRWIKGQHPDLARADATTVPRRARDGLCGVHVDAACSRRRIGRCVRARAARHHRARGRIVAERHLEHGGFCACSVRLLRRHVHRAHGGCALGNLEPRARGADDAALLAVTHNCRGCAPCSNSC